MKALNTTITALFTLFLIICIGVHVYGLIAPFSDEPVYSHIIHLTSYCLCLYALLRVVPYRVFIYLFAAVYPWMYHAKCAWFNYTVHDKLNGICILVVIMMPLIAAWIWKKSLVEMS